MKTLQRVRGFLGRSAVGLATVLVAVTLWGQYALAQTPTPAATATPTTTPSRTSLTGVLVPYLSGQPVPFAPAATDMKVPNAGGNTVLIIRTAATAATVTVYSVQEPTFQRTGDATVTCYSQSVCILGPFKPIAFNSRTEKGYMYVKFSATTNVEAAAMQLQGF